MSSEIEVKSRVGDLRTLRQKLRAAGFRLKTRRTHEMNTLYDLPGGALRKHKELLRLRQYGSEWKLTFKSKGKIGRHSTGTSWRLASATGK
jgi:inorganic triphosphatase YgiF